MVDSFPTKAISVHAPWAWALMFAGKDIENRTGRKPGKAGGHSFPQNVLGRVWVAASMWPKPGEMKETSIFWDRFVEVVDAMTRTAPTPLQEPSGAEQVMDLARRIALLRGHIVGSIEVYGYQQPNDPPASPWYVSGSLAILVRDPRPLVRPVPAKGALGWWKPNESEMAQLREAHR